MIYMLKLCIIKQFYMKLPNKLKPKFLYDLNRIGSSHDGGYLIEK